MNAWFLAANDTATALFGVIFWFDISAIIFHLSMLKSSAYIFEHKRRTCTESQLKLH